MQIEVAHNFINKRPGAKQLIVYFAFLDGIAICSFDSLRDVFNGEAIQDTLMHFARKIYIVYKTLWQNQ